jgi:hypothetical protein
MFRRLNFTSCRGSFSYTEQPDDPRDGDLEPHGVDPIVLVRLELGLERGDLLPRLEVEVLPLRVTLGVGLDVHDLGQLAAEQRERPADVHHPDGLVELVENENVGGERGRQCEARADATPGSRS